MQSISQPIDSEKSAKLLDTKGGFKQSLVYKKNENQTVVYDCTLNRYVPSSYLPSDSVASGVILHLDRDVPALVQLAKVGWFGRALMKSPRRRGGLRHLVRRIEETAMKRL